MKKTLLLSISAAALLASPSVFAGSWHYNPPSPSPSGGYYPQQPAYPAPAPQYPAQPGNNGPVCNTMDRGMLESLHSLDVEQIALANLALQRSGDRRVRDYASQVDRDQRFLDDALFRRASELGVRLDDRAAAYTADLQYLSGPAFDVAYLERSIDGYDRVRPSFADFKERTGGGFHQALARSFDDLVRLREIAKPLHDDIRNASRGGYDNGYGSNDYGGNDDRYGRRHDRGRHRGW